MVPIVRVREFGFNREKKLRLIFTKAAGSLDENDQNFVDNYAVPLFDNLNKTGFSLTQAPLTNLNFALTDFKHFRTSVQHMISGVEVRYFNLLMVILNNDDLQGLQEAIKDADISVCF